MNIELPILESIKDLQTQHGLKYENYRRYRSYCSRRLHRLRRSLNVHQGIPTSARARHQRGRKLMDINNSMVLEAGEKNSEYAERMLIIPLCLAERAWSYAMQLKQEISDCPRRRFHLVRRLKKATEHAQRFEKLCLDPESPCTERTKEEATAYAAYITGLYQVERESWAEAKENLGKALLTYFKLSVSVKKSDVLEHYRQRIDELRASLRYCAFNLPDQDDKKEIKVKLPARLQFHDIALNYAEEANRECQMSKAAANVMKTGAKETVKMEVDEKVEHEEDEDDKDEFQMAKEKDDDEEDDDEDEEDEEEDEGRQAPSGLTGIVKNWLGGPWS